MVDKSLKNKSPDEELQDLFCLTILKNTYLDKNTTWYYTFLYLKQTFLIIILLFKKYTYGKKIYWNWEACKNSVS